MHQKGTIGCSSPHSSSWLSLAVSEEEEEGGYKRICGTGMMVVVKGAFVVAAAAEVLLVVVGKQDFDLSVKPNHSIARFHSSSFG